MPRTKEFVPANYSELFSHYYEYVQKLVVASGIEFQSAEDVTMAILTTFMEKDVLSDFDPERVHHGRKAVFMTFLSGFVRIYVRHYRDKQAKLVVREGRSTDVRISQFEGDVGGDTWIDVFGPIVETDYDAVYDASFLSGIRSHLATASAGRKDSKLDLVAFFDALMTQMDMDGEVSTTALMAHFGVTRTTIHNWMDRLRTEVAVALEMSA